jgi:Protein of unknown function (DUF3072)
MENEKELRNCEMRDCEIFSSCLRLSTGAQRSYLQTPADEANEDVDLDLTMAEASNKCGGWKSEKVHWSYIFCHFSFSIFLYLVHIGVRICCESFKNDKWKMANDL